MKQMSAAHSGPCSPSLCEERRGSAPWAVLCDRGHGVCSKATCSNFGGCLLRTGPPEQGAGAGLPTPGVFEDFASIEPQCHVYEDTAGLWAPIEAWLTFLSAHSLPSSLSSWLVQNRSSANRCQ